METSPQAAEMSLVYFQVLGAVCGMRHVTFNVIRMYAVDEIRYGFTSTCVSSTQSLSF